jgi:uncharacterized protein DUF6308
MRLGPGRSAASICLFGRCSVLEPAKLLAMTDYDFSSNGVAHNAKQRLIANLATARLGDAVARYFDPVQPFAGRTFDSLGDNPRDKIVPDDLLAVTLLDVRWTPLAVRRLLYGQADEISKLLGEIDDKTELGAPDSGKQLDAAGPLWDLMYQLPGVRDTKASKLLARKRPRLIPITDSIVVSAVRTPGRTWATLHCCFQDTCFRQTVESLRPEKTELISLLRIFDVAIWMLFSQSKAAKEARRETGVAPSLGA